MRVKWVTEVFVLKEATALFNFGLEWTSVQSCTERTFFTVFYAIFKYSIMVEVVYIHTVYLYFIGKIRVFFKVLSSQSFFKGKQLWVQRTHTMGFPSFLLTQLCINISKSNMADKTSYCSYCPATAARFIKKTVPIRMFLN